MIPLVPQGDWMGLARGFLKMKKELPPAMEQLLCSAHAQLMEQIRPGFVYALFACRPTPLGIELAPGGFCLPGESARRHLAGCDRAVLMCVSLGEGAERALRQAQTRDMALCVVMDAVASALVECACDQAQDLVQQRLQAPGVAFTRRFSPGYGDLPLDIQEGFLSLLRAQHRLGVSALEGGTLVPRKTVTAFWGLQSL